MNVVYFETLIIAQIFAKSGDGIHPCSFLKIVVLTPDPFEDFLSFDDVVLFSISNFNRSASLWVSVFSDSPEWMVRFYNQR